MTTTTDFPTATATVTIHEECTDLVVVSSTGDLIHADVYKDVAAAANAALKIDGYRLTFHISPAK